ncbi:hypothetical protein [Ammoniphilus resinae]|uniref:Uncharacterized protein n=1 Tax=Ammoniphilus resinae TaxID=861532 RepID=A0ABS4GMH1_9BACL|nr:hypothetical protein [Ammoniphilus resinae]MBP1931470.1 hypothetical protein [Ammoniphilus resinae]
MRKRIQHRSHSTEQQIVSYKIPPREKQKEIQQILWNQKRLTMYSDCSQILHHGIYGLGAMFVCGGTTRTYSKKIYSRYVNKSTLGEYYAVAFTIQQVPSFLRDTKEVCPEYLKLFTDIEIQWDHLREEYQEAINDIQKQLAVLTLPFEISNMTNEEKRCNPFYRAAHNASRKAIGK